jgi:hypothetical protein
VDQSGPGPTDPDLVGRPTHAGTPHLIIYDELCDRVGPEAPGAGPVGRHIAGVGQLTRRGPGVFGQPSPKLVPRRVLVSRKGEVHAAKRRLYG